MIKPITSRVQSATQKGERIIEPLLNVGAAGVKGGSATRKSPSPLKAEVDPTLGAGEVDKENQDDSNSETTTETQETAADSKDTLITNADVTGNGGGDEDQEDVIPIVDNIEPKRTSSREENTERLGVERQDRRTDRNIARRELRRIGREAARDARQSDGGTRADGFKARRDITLGRSFGNDYQEKLYNTARGITGNEEANSEMRDRARETATTSGIAAAENSALDGVIPGKKKVEQSSRVLNNIPEDNSEAENFEFTRLPQGKTVDLKSKKGSIPTPKGAKLKPIGERPAQKSNLDRALDQKNQDVKDANDDQLNEYNKNPFNPNTTGQIGGRDQAPQSDYRPRPIELTKPKDSEMSDGTPRAENSRSFVSKDRMIKPEDSRMVDGTPTRENNKSVISMAQMRMNSNVGIKSKSPMKKGYFNGK